MAKVACLIAGMLMGFTATHLLWSARYDNHLRADSEAKMKAAFEVIDIERDQSSVTAAVGAGVAEKTIAIQHRTQEVIRDVPKIITPDIDRRYPLPYGALRVYDASLGVSGPADGAGKPDDAPSPVATSDAFAVIAGNNGQCLEWREQLIGWQDWYAQQKALSEGSVK